MQQDEADKVFRTLVDRRLRDAGFASGINASLDINYVQTPKGEAALHIVARTTDGDRKGIFIGIPDFKAQHRELTRPAAKAGKGHPLAGYPFDEVGFNAVARGVIAPSERVRKINGVEYAVPVGIGTGQRKLPANWRTLPVKDSRWLIKQ